LATAGLLLAMLLVLFRDTAAAMVAIWWRSETFTHAFLVPPIVGWLVWRRRHVLAGVEPRPAYWMLLPMAAVCVLWLLGELASVNAATQLALVTLIILCVPALFGIAAARLILFPLAFLYFSVPIGDFLVPPMMALTADFTVLALRASGVPVYREGLQFVIPSGNWSVVEACSGVRYLIASFMVGTLYAYLNYRSMRRRVIFVAFALAVPIVANWFRAYLIVMLAHLSDNQLAAGVDHLIYGWVFFGIVILVMFWVGARWAEPDADDIVRTSSTAGAAGMRGSTLGIALAIVALLSATQAMAWRLQRVEPSAAPVVALPAVAGLQLLPAPPTADAWVPGFGNPSGIAAQRYRTRNGETIDVWVGYYRGQGYDRKLVSSTNTLIAADQPNWAQLDSGALSVSTSSGSLQMRTAELRLSPLLGGGETRRLRVWQTYWVGGEFIAGDTRARLQLALNRLLGRGDDGAVVMMSTPIVAGHDADEALHAFAPAYLEALSARLSATRSAR
jgi:exosortase A